MVALAKRFQSLALPNQSSLRVLAEVHLRRRVDQVTQRCPEFVWDRRLMQQGAQSKSFETTECGYYSKDVNMYFTCFFRRILLLYLLGVAANNVLLVKIEGPVWYTIYHHLPVVKGVSSNPSINQPTNGKGHLWLLQLVDKSTLVIERG